MTSARRICPLRRSHLAADEGDLPLKTQIAFIRRKMAEQGMGNYDKVLPTQKKSIPIKPITQ